MNVTFITSKGNWHKGWFLKPEDLSVAIEAIESNGISVKVQEVSTSDELEHFLDRVPPDTLLWANAYYVNTQNGKLAWLNDYISERNLPLIGSDSNTLKKILEKDVCQTTLHAEQVPTPSLTIVKKEDFTGSIQHINLEQLTFPLVVKPSNEGGSLGVKLVHEPTSLLKHIQFIFETLDTSTVLIESFIAHDDITCGHIQLGNKALLLPSYYVIKNAPGQTHILSRENQFKPWNENNKIQFFIDDETILEQIKNNVPRISKVFNICDITRVDGRVDCEGILRFYDVNGYPGLRYAKSVTIRQCALYFPNYTEQEVYKALLNTMLYNTMLRYNKDVPPSLVSCNLFNMNSNKIIQVDN